jgi:integrase
MAMEPRMEPWSHMEPLWWLHGTSGGGSIMARWDAKRGAWRIVVDVSGAGEKRRRRYRDVDAPNTRAGKKIAELAEAKLRIEAAQAAERAWPGASVKDGTTFAAVASGWVERRRPDWSPKTYKETRYSLCRYILPIIGSTPIDQVTPRQIEAMYAAWGGDGFAASTMRRWHGIVRTIFADAERLGEMASPNPMVRVRPAGGRAPERRIPSPDEVRRVIKAARSVADALYFELAAATGARRGTLVALRWSDVDIESGTISCVQAVTEGCDGPVLKETKASRAYDVRVTGSALDTLREHRSQAAETALALGISGRFEDLFVFSRDGGPAHWNVSWPTMANGARKPHRRGQGSPTNGGDQTPTTRCR